MGGFLVTSPAVSALQSVLRVEGALDFHKSTVSNSSKLEMITCI